MKSHEKNPDRTRPFLLGAMAALLVCQPLFVSESAAVEGNGMPLVMLWIALAVLWLLDVVGRPRTALRFGWIDGCVLLLIGWHTAAGVLAARHLAARPAINVLWEWVGLGLLFFLARQFLRGLRETRAVVAVLIAMAVGASVYGFYQWAWEIPQRQQLYQAAPDRALQDAEVWFAPGSPERQRFEDRLRDSRPTATFALSNSLATFLVPALILAGAIALREFKRKVWLARAAAGCAVPIAVGLALTRSRSGCIAAIVGLGLTWLTRRRWCITEEDNAILYPSSPRAAPLGSIEAVQEKPHRACAAYGITIIAVLAVAAVAAVLHPGPLLQAGRSLTYRFEYWQATMRMIADHPLTGCGPGNFQNAYTLYKLPQASEEVAEPHNFLLEVAATAGLPAGLALLAVLGCFATGTVPIFASAKMGLSPSAAPVDADLKADRPGFVAVGALAGFLLAFLLRAISAAPPPVEAIWIGLVCAVACLALLWKWIDAGRLPAAIPALAVLGLAVDWLTSGGIGFPGVAAVFWLLLVVGLNAATSGDCPNFRLGENGTVPFRIASTRTMPRAGAFVLLAAVMGIGAAAHWSAYAPVLYCQMDMQRARAASELRLPSVELLKSAASDDPWDARPWRQLAEQTFAQWSAHPDATAYGEFEDYLQKALAREPNLALAWKRAGDNYLAAFFKTQRASDAAKAIEHYRRAVELYPNNGLFHGQLALAHAAAADPGAAQREATEALRLDALTPHSDRKLSAELAEQLRVLCAEAGPNGQRRAGAPAG